MNKRGAYFFVLDALIGGSIFLVSVILILGSYMNVPETRQSYLLAEDLMSIIQTTKIIDFRDPYIEYLADNGSITNPEQSLFQQIAQLHYVGKQNQSYNLTKNILLSLITEEYGVSYSIINGTSNETTIIFNQSVERENLSKRMLSSRKIVFYAVEQTSFFGPDIVELRLWK